MVSPDNKISCKGYDSSFKSHAMQIREYTGSFDDFYNDLFGGKLVPIKSADNYKWSFALVWLTGKIGEPDYIKLIKNQKGPKTWFYDYIHGHSCYPKGKHVLVFKGRFITKITSRNIQSTSERSKARRMSFREALVKKTMIEKRTYSFVEIEPP